MLSCGGEGLSSFSDQRGFQTSAESELVFCRPAASAAAGGEERSAIRSKTSRLSTMAFPYWMPRHSPTGCQGIPCRLRQADAWLAMANSNGEDLMSLSDPIGLQIVAEKWIDFTPSGGLGWRRKSSALCSKASSSSTLWWRSPIPGVSVRTTPWTLSTVFLRVEGCLHQVLLVQRGQHSGPPDRAHHVQKKNRWFESLAAKPKTTKLDEVHHHQIHTSRLPRMIRNHMYTRFYQAPCQLCLTTSLLATYGISHEGPRFFTLVQPWRTSISLIICNWTCEYTSSPILLKMILFLCLEKENKKW